MASGGKLTMPQFPALESVQRAGGRTKVALKPGHSLMDWIRLTHSSNDLAGTGGKALEITPEELKKHNKKDDAWICLKGKVYNVTAYMSFHPGGDDELMKGVGKDATDIFNEVHQWVNYESMLQKCYVGRLQMPSIYLRRSSSGSLNFLLSNDLISSQVKDPTQPNGQLNQVVPRFDWFQTESTVSLVIFTRWKEIKEEHVVIDVRAEKQVICIVHIHKYIYQTHLDLEFPVQQESKVKIGKRGSGTVEVMLEKMQKGKTWSNVGTPLSGNASFIKAKNADLLYCSGKLISKKPITHDTFLFTFELLPGTKMTVPVGHHICLRAPVEDVEVIRSYTPVPPTLSLNAQTCEEENRRHLHLMIKIYSKGALTPTIESLQIGDSIDISDYRGDFKEARLRQCSVLVLIAAGTGFTPMARLILWVFQEDNQDRKMKLLFFNKQEKDILWKDQLDLLSNENDRFHVQYVLSNPSEDWKGDRGRVRLQLLKNFLPSEDSESKLLICVCGPTPFTKLTLAYLEEMGYSPDAVHAFTG